MIRTRVFALPILVLLLICFTAVSAQNKSPDKAAPSNDLNMPMPKPGPEMEKIKFQIGTWKVTEKHESGLGFSGGEGKGLFNVKLGPGSLSLISEYKSVSPMGEFAGHGILVWDQQEKAYKSYWFSNYMAGGNVTTGKWDGQELVFTGEMEMMGKKYATKEVWTDIAPDSFAIKSYLSDGGPMTLVFSLKAVKQ